MLNNFFLIEAIEALCNQSHYQFVSVTFTPSRDKNISHRNRKRICNFAHPLLC